MSVIQRKPFIQSVMESLTQSLKTTLLGLVNGSDKTPDFRSLVNESALITGSDKNKVQYVTLETWAKLYTGYLIYNNSYCVLIAFSSNTQALVMLDINATNRSYKVVKEYLDINELRRYIEEADEHIVATEIDSGTATAGQVLAADGDGGAEWTDVMDTITPETVQEGDAVQLFGFDANGNLVKDDIPEGIVVDETIIEDSPNAVAGGAVYDEITPMKADIEQKANKDGNYQTMTVGLANNFDSKLTENDKSAYILRPTATMGSVELEVGSPCKVKKIVGGTVAFNQKVKNGNFANTSDWSNSYCTFSVASNICTVVPTAQWACIYQSNLGLTNGHKFYIKAEIKLTTGNTNIGLGFRQTSGGGNFSNVIWTANTTSWQTVEGIKINSETGHNGIVIVDKRSSDWDNWQVKNVVAYDLTLMFGSIIADYIYTLESGTPGAGIAWFHRYFPKTYYAYSASQLVSVKTSGKKIVKFNQAISFENGANSNAYQTALRAKINWLPNTTYCISFVGASGHKIYANEFLFELVNGYTWSATCDGTRQYALLTTKATFDQAQYADGEGGWLIFKNSGSNTITPDFQDVCINFHYDGERDGEYEPYETETYAMEDVELRGIPKLDSNNNLVFDGDEYNSDGTQTVKYRLIDLSNINFQHSDSGEVGFWASGFLSVKAKVIDNYTSANIFSENYPIPTGGYQVGGGTGSIGKFAIATNGTNTYVVVNNGSTETAPSGYMIYEVDEPTTAALEPFAETQECDNWGTEQFLSPESDTRPCEVPVGHDTDYLPDLKAKLESAPTTPSEDGYYVLQHEESSEGNPNAYAEMNTVLAAEGYEKNVAAQANIGGILRHMISGVDFNNTDYVDLGSLTWNHPAAWPDSTFYATLTNGKASSGTTGTANGICPKYNAQAATKENISDKSFTLGSTQVGGGNIMLKDTSYSDTASLKAALKGILLAYEKAS